MHDFDYEDVDYPEGFEEEIFVRKPLTELYIQRLIRIQLKQLIIPPRNGHPAAHCTCTDDYTTKTGEIFDGKQIAALQWYAALQNA